MRRDAKKTGGRKPGSTNKATTDIKSKIATLIDSQFDAITSRPGTVGAKRPGNGLFEVSGVRTTQTAGAENRPIHPDRRTGRRPAK